MEGAAWLRLAKAVPAKLGGDALLMLDLGPSHALLSGRCSYAPGTEHEVAFAEIGIRVRVRCRITAVERHQLAPESDVLVRFLERSEALEELIARYQEQIHLAEAANAEGDSARNVIHGDRMLSDLGSAARSRQTFLRCQLGGDGWSREATAVRDQPRDGFTISASETADQIQLLQLAYEESDEPERQLLREFAAASLPPER
ncbi:MAG TPA: hypothetical protein VF432_28425 [Thermoanaerobaculia bacterium]